MKVSLSCSFSVSSVSSFSSSSSAWSERATTHSCKDTGDLDLTGGNTTLSLCYRSFLIVSLATFLSRSLTSSSIFSFAFSAAYTNFFLELFSILKYKSWLQIYLKLKILIDNINPSCQAHPSPVWVGKVWWFEADFGCVRLNDVVWGWLRFNQGLPRTGFQFRDRDYQNPSLNIKTETESMNHAVSVTRLEIL